MFVKPAAPRPISAGIKPDGGYANDDTRLDGWSSSYRSVGVSVDYRRV